MKCPRCNAEGAVELVDEVDIGVGTIRNVHGYECPKCGPVAVCRSCGQPDFLPHAKWCETTSLDDSDGL
jgi:hypothetical protein